MVDVEHLKAPEKDGSGWSLEELEAGRCESEGQPCRRTRVVAGSCPGGADEDFGPYRMRYFERKFYETLKGRQGPGYFPPSSDRLNFELLAEAASKPVDAQASKTLAVFGSAGSGRTALLDLVWQALERRQAESHAEERPKRIAACEERFGASCGLCCWRCCCRGDVDRSSNTLTGFYVPVRISCAQLLGNDRPWAGSEKGDGCSPVSREAREW